MLALVLADDEGPTLPESWAAARGTRAERMNGLKYMMNPARGLRKKVMNINKQRTELENVNWHQCRKECTWMDRNQTHNRRHRHRYRSTKLHPSSPTSNCHEIKLRTETPHRPIRLTLIYQPHTESHADGTATFDPPGPLRSR